VKVYVKCDGPCAAMMQLQPNQSIPPHWRRVQVMGETEELIDLLYCDKCFPGAVIAAADDFKLSSEPPKPTKKPRGSAANKGQP